MGLTRSPRPHFPPRFPGTGRCPGRPEQDPLPGRALHGATPPWGPALPTRDPPLPPHRFPAPSQRPLLSFGVFSFRAGPIRATFPRPRRGARPPPPPGRAEPPGPGPRPRPALTAPVRSGPARLGSAGPALAPPRSRCSPGALPAAPRPAPPRHAGSCSPAAGERRSRRGNRRERLRNGDRGLHRALLHSHGAPDPAGCVQPARGGWAAPPTPLFPGEIRDGGTLGQLPQGAAVAPSLEVFEARWNGAWGDLGYWNVSLPAAEGETKCF